MNTGTQRVEKIESDTPKLSWLTRIAMMLGLSTGHAATAAEKREKSAEDFEGALRDQLPEECRDGNVLPLVFYPNALLKQKSHDVEVFDADIVQLVQSMGATMYLCGGVGLSAIQVGVPLRVIVTDLRNFEQARQDKFRVFINPVILSADTPVRLIEGCLSVPNIRETVERANKVVVRAQHFTGVSFETVLEGWPARVFLHEYDHLEGQTLLDELSPGVRRLAEKKIQKMRRSVTTDTKNGQRKAQLKASRGRGR